MAGVTEGQGHVAMRGAAPTPQGGWAWPPEEVPLGIELLVSARMGQRSGAHPGSCRGSPKQAQPSPGGSASWRGSQSAPACCVDWAILVCAFSISQTGAKWPWRRGSWHRASGGAALSISTAGVLILFNFT